MAVGEVVKRKENRRVCAEKEAEKVEKSAMALGTESESDFLLENRMVLKTMRDAERDVQRRGCGEQVVGEQSHGEVSWTR